MQHAAVAEVDAERYNVSYHIANFPRYVDLAHGLQRRYDDAERNRYVKREGPAPTKVL